MTRFHKISIIIGLMTIMVFVAVKLLLSVKSLPLTQKEKKELEHNRLVEHTKILQDSVADLEAKARILNYYLHAKHLEYMDACKLVEHKK